MDAAPTFTRPTCQSSTQAPPAPYLHAYQTPTKWLPMPDKSLNTWMALRGQAIQLRGQGPAHLKSRVCNGCRCCYGEVSTGPAQHILIHHNLQQGKIQKMVTVDVRLRGEITDGTTTCTWATRAWHGNKGWNWEDFLKVWCRMRRTAQGEGVGRHSWVGGGLWRSPHATVHCTEDILNLPT